MILIGCWGAEYPPWPPWPPWPWPCPPSLFCNRTLTILTGACAGPEYPPPYPPPCPPPCPPPYPPPCPCELPLSWMTWKNTFVQLNLTLTLCFQSIDRTQWQWLTEIKKIISIENVSLNFCFCSSIALANVKSSYLNDFDLRCWCWITTSMTSMTSMISMTMTSALRILNTFFHYFWNRTVNW